MGRILLLLGVAALAATFVLVLNMPMQSLFTGSPSVAAPASPEPPKDTQAKKQPPPAPARARKQRAAKFSPSSNPVAAGTTVPDAAPAPPEADSNPDPSEATVKHDPTPMHSLNSPSSSVVWLLKKGDKVRADVEVIQHDGVWSIVQRSGQAKPGYVRGENLERARQPNRSTRRAPSRRAGP